MPGIIDIFSLVLTFGFIGLFVYAVLYVVNAVNQGLESTKANLKSKGLDVSSTGVSMKTSKTFTRQDYLDATQRGMVHLVESATIHRGNDTTGTSVSVLHSEPSTSSKGTSNTGDKKKGIFSRKKSVDH